MALQWTKSYSWGQFSGPRNTLLEGKYSFSTTYKDNLETRHFWSLVGETNRIDDWSTVPQVQKVLSRPKFELEIEKA